MYVGEGTETKVLIKRNPEFPDPDIHPFIKFLIFRLTPRQIEPVVVIVLGGFHLHYVGGVAVKIVAQAGYEPGLQLLKRKEELRRLVLNCDY